MDPEIKEAILKMNDSLSKILILLQKQDSLQKEAIEEAKRKEARIGESLSVLRDSMPEGMRKMIDPIVKGGSHGR